MSESGWETKIWQYSTSALGGTESSSSLSEAEREKGVSRAVTSRWYFGLVCCDLGVKARRHEGAKERPSYREDMAEVSEVLMSVLSTIRVPRPGDRVHKDECALSFASPVSLLLHTLHTLHLHNCAFSLVRKSFIPLS